MIKRSCCRIHNSRVAFLLISFSKIIHSLHVHFNMLDKNKTAVRKWLKHKGGNSVEWMTNTKQNSWCCIYPLWKHLRLNRDVLAAEEQAFGKRSRMCPIKGFLSSIPGQIPIIFSSSTYFLLCEWHWAIVINEMKWCHNPYSNYIRIMKSLLSITMEDKPFPLNHFRNLFHFLHMMALERTFVWRNETRTVNRPHIHMLGTLSLNKNNNYNRYWLWN